MLFWWCLVSTDNWISANNEVISCLGMFNVQSGGKKLSLLGHIKLIKKNMLLLIYTYRDE